MVRGSFTGSTCLIAISGLASQAKLSGRSSKTTPNQPPVNPPAINVTIPPKNNTCSNFFVPPVNLKNFKNINEQIVKIIPYPASVKQRPKKNDKKTSQKWCWIHFAIPGETINTCNKLKWCHKFGIFHNNRHRFIFFYF